MKSARHIEKLIRTMDVSSSTEAHERTLTDLVASHIERTRGALRPATWITSRRVGTAVAAGFILLALFGALALYESAAPVYAVEQTVAAIRRIPVVHIFGQDWDDQRLEMWIKVNPDTGLMDSCHVRYLDDDRYMVSTPRNTYDYDGRTNTVRIKDVPGRFLPGHGATRQNARGSDYPLGGHRHGHPPEHARIAAQRAADGDCLPDRSEE
jgi:hypothetical protein